MKSLLKAVIISTASMFSATNAIAIEQNIEPYGYEVFNSTSSISTPSITDPNRLISYGDRVLVRLWGALNEELLLMVDADGTIFLPESGPVRISGMTLSQAKLKIKDSVSRIYNENVNVHTTLADVKPITVFVTGNVNRAGRYSGNQNDTILDFLAKAEGINPLTGSSREILIRRGGKVITIADLYDFIKLGILPDIQFKNNDTIVVVDKKTEITVIDGARNNSAFEFLSKTIKGSELIKFAMPNNNISHAKISVSNSTSNQDKYYPLSKFKTVDLSSGDIVEFISDKPTNTINVSVQGDTIGQKKFSISKKTSLKELLSHIAIDPDLVNIDAIHIERKSVAKAQKAALDQSLFKLQQTALLKPSETTAEMQVRSSEAKLIEAFVKQAKETQFPGKVVIKNRNDFNDIRLEDGDKIIIPQKTEVVMINGQVNIPNAFLHSDNLRVADYIHKSGGLTENADREKIIINKQDGSSKIAGINDKIEEGDTILILPKADTKEFIFAKELVGIMYQVAVAANILLPSL